MATTLGFSAALQLRTPVGSQDREERAKRHFPEQMTSPLSPKKLVQGRCKNHHPGPQKTKYKHPVTQWNIQIQTTKYCFSYQESAKSSGVNAAGTSPGGGALYGKRDRGDILGKHFGSMHELSTQFQGSAFTRIHLQASPSCLLQGKAL